MTRMTRDEAYREAEQRIKGVQRWSAYNLDLSGLSLTELPESLSQLSRLAELYLNNNQLTALPEWLGQLSQLQILYLGDNRLTALPESLGRLSWLQTLDLGDNRLTALPESLGQLSQLQILILRNNRLTTLPESLGQLSQLQTLFLKGNPLNSELAAAYEEGLYAVKRYLRAKAEAQVVLNEAKLILIGEGEVGKSCLLGALRGDPWVEGRPTTHGIEIKPVKVTDSTTGTEITLNGWDFGGQRVYRPTHQLFFSAPAVYLVVWKPREGPQQGFVKEWIKLVKHREPNAKILVVATHGGPQERQPDIDQQDFFDLFGEETVLGFFHVDSKPDANKQYVGIEALKKKIAEVAISLPEVGRKVAKNWHAARVALKELNRAYIETQAAVEICAQHKMSREDARLFLTMEHRLGHIIYYDNDLLLCNIVILKPDWLATAISYVLDDKETREKRNGLVSFERLSQLWSDPKRELRYAPDLHPLFVRLMEHFDLSYKVAVPHESEDGIGVLQRLRSFFGGGSKAPAQKESYTSLIAQLVPDMRPKEKLAQEWPDSPAAGDEEQVQICRIVETAHNQSATTEGLFYKLIVRLHKFSLGRADVDRSVHWQRGLILADETGARARLELIGNDVKITVRSPYPARFLGALTLEVQYLVQSFWPGLRCDVTVPCLAPPNKNGERCKGLFEVNKLLNSKKRRRTEMLCQLCDEWQSIDELLGNAPDARPNPLGELQAEQAIMLQTLDGIRVQLATQQVQVLGRFDHLDASNKEIVSKVEEAYAGLMRTLLDEAKEGPRLFSLQPVDAGFLDRPNWIAQKFRLTLWCEHSRMPLPLLPSLNKGNTKSGVYEFEIPRTWFAKAAPALKTFASIASLTLPVAGALLKMELDNQVYTAMEKELDFGQKCVESMLQGGGEALKDEEGLADPKRPAFKGSKAEEAMEAEGAVLRQLQVWLKERDPSFGGLVRVLNRRREFLWVHPDFVKEY